MERTVSDTFKEVFGQDEVYPAGSDPVRCFAPGRVNLIGEHTDYNGGHVFPCALTLGTYGVCRKRSDRRIRLYSVNFPETGIIETNLDDLTPGEDHGWEAYVKGVIWTLMGGAAAGADACCDKSAGRISSGLDIVIGGNLPAGAGLSSSASVEVLIGVMLREQFGLDITNEEIALTGQRAENEYVGMKCGIMDQFASAMGKMDSAIYLDTATLDYEYVPLNLGNRKLIITNTNKKHSLADSAYNDRRRECEEALQIIRSDEALRILRRSADDVTALGDLTPSDFGNVQDLISDPVLLRRAKHAVTENQRTKDAVDVLKAGDLAAFGQLMKESHISLRDDYEVSCPELDCLAETAWEVPGVVGSRMTGGGFGGCTVSIVEEDAVDRFKEVVGSEYRKRFGHDCTFIIESAGDGPKAEALKSNKFVPPET
ncbi:MAG: galactokinase [Eubacterium sp.]|nr:galactokinase [Eubacterium sp.]